MFWGLVMWCLLSMLLMPFECSRMILLSMLLASLVTGLLYAYLLGYIQIHPKTCFSMIQFLLKPDRYARSYGFRNFWVAWKGTKRSRMAPKVLFFAITYGTCIIFRKYWIMHNVCKDHSWAEVNRRLYCIIFDYLPYFILLPITFTVVWQPILVSCIAKVIQPPYCNSSCKGACGD